MSEAEKQKTTAVQAPQDFHVRLLISKLRRRQITLAVVFGFVAFLVILASESKRSESKWWITALPIAALGVIISAIPSSEQWEYKPWQARPRQYERHQIERNQNQQSE